MIRSIILLIPVFLFAAGCLSEQKQIKNTRAHAAHTKISKKEEPTSSSSSSGFFSTAKKIAGQAFWDSKKDAWYNGTHYLQKAGALGLAVLGGLCIKNTVSAMQKEWNTDRSGYSIRFVGKPIRGASESGLFVLTTLCTAVSLTAGASALSPSHVSVPKPF